MKIKGYEAAALPKSRSRKRHSSLSQAEARWEKERRRTSIVHGKAKKKGIIKRRGIYTTRKTRWWRKVEGERKRLEEKEVVGEKRVEREGMGVEG